MTRRKILNITSHKKKDNMLSFSNEVADTQSGDYANGPALLMGTRTYLFPWVCTARDLGASDSNESARTRSSVYWRGIKEKIQVQTNNGRPWQWRRICFQVKRQDMLNTTAAKFRWWSTFPNVGVVRLVNDVSNNAASAGMLLGALFDGAQGTDWVSYFTAKVDTNRVKLCYDKTRIISAGNDQGMMRNYNQWHPMNKTMYYEDDENGFSEDYGPYASGSRKGMSDYIIFDIIAAGTGGSIADRLSFNPEATAYWHEK